MLSFVRKIVTGFKNAFIMNRVLENMAAGQYEGAIKEIDKLQGAYIQTEALLIKCYALGKLGRADEIEVNASDALKFIGSGNYSSIAEMYVRAYAEAVCPSIVNSKYFRKYELEYLKDNIQNVSPTLRRALPLVL